ncbi:FecR family protein [Luteimonas sp. RIT-PG2_3]
MSEIHQLPSLEDAEREAAAWIARLNADDVSAEDRAGFEAWRARHPRHARAYQQMAQTWQQCLDAGRTVRAVSFGNAMQVASQTQPPWQARWRGFAAAAMVAAVMIAGVLWSVHPPASFRTGVGERASIALLDGSTLELNSDSAVRVSYRDDRRVVRLDRGEVFVKVAHDRERPFWVVADQTWVRAVGTAFSVYRREQDVRVTVSEGKVSVVGAALMDVPADGDLPRLPASLLGAGQQIDARGASVQVRALPQAEVGRELSWRQGLVHFDNQPLSEVVAQMRRYTPLQIELGASARDIAIGGTFRADPQGAEALLSTLQDGFGLTVSRPGGERVRVE